MNAIDTAERNVQKAYEGDGDLTEALVELRRVYAVEGYVGNKTTIVDNTVRVLQAMKKMIFLSDEQRAANAEAVEREKAQAEEDATKQRLYDEHMKKKKK